MRFTVTDCGALFFFFSSRRRHTRSDRDWSSDVCSSDLCQDESVMRFLSQPCLFFQQTCGRHPQGAEENRSEEHTSELQSRSDLVCRLLLEKKKKSHNDRPLSETHV